MHEPTSTDSLVIQSGIDELLSICNKAENLFFDFADKFLFKSKIHEHKKEYEITVPGTSEKRKYERRLMSIHEMRVYEGDTLEQYTRKRLKIDKKINRFWTTQRKRTASQKGKYYTNLVEQGNKIGLTRKDLKIDSTQDNEEYQSDSEKEEENEEPEVKKSNSKLYKRFLDEHTLCDIHQPHRLFQREIILELRSYVEKLFPQFLTKNRYFNLIKSSTPILITELKQEHLDQSSLPSFRFIKDDGTRTTYPSDFSFMHYQYTEEKVKAENPISILNALYKEANQVYHKGENNSFKIIYTMTKMVVDGYFATDVHMKESFFLILASYLKWIENCSTQVKDFDLYRIPVFTDRFAPEWDSLFLLRTASVEAALYNLLTLENAKMSKNMHMIFCDVTCLQFLSNRINIEAKGLAVPFMLYIGAKGNSKKTCIHSHPVFTTDIDEIMKIWNSEPSFRPATECKQCDTSFWDNTQEGRYELLEKYYDKQRTKIPALKHAPFNDLLQRIDSELYFEPNSSVALKGRCAASMNALPFMNGLSTDVLMKKLKEQKERREEQAEFRKTKEGKMKYDKFYEDCKRHYATVFTVFLRNVSSGPYNWLNSMHRAQTSRSSSMGSVKLRYSVEYEWKGKQYTKTVNISDTSKKVYALFSPIHDFNRAILMLDTMEEFYDKMEKGIKPQVGEIGERRDRKAPRQIYTTNIQLNTLGNLVFKQLVNFTAQFPKGGTNTTTEKCYGTYNVSSQMTSGLGIVAAALQTPNLPNLMFLCTDGTAFDINSPHETMAHLFTQTYVDTVKKISGSKKSYTDKIVNLDGRPISYIECCELMAEFFEKPRPFRIRSKGDAGIIPLKHMPSGIVFTFEGNTEYNKAIQMTFDHEMFNECINMHVPGLMATNEKIAGDDIAKLVMTDSKSKITSTHIRAIAKAQDTTTKVIAMEQNPLKSCTGVFDFAQRSVTNNFLMWNVPVSLQKEKETKSELSVDSRVGFSNTHFLATTRNPCTKDFTILQLALGMHLHIGGERGNRHGYVPDLMMQFLPTDYNGSAFGILRVDDQWIQTLTCLNMTKHLIDLLGVAAMFVENQNDEIRFKMAADLREIYLARIAGKKSEKEANFEFRHDREQELSLSFENIKDHLHREEPRIKQNEEFMRSLYDNERYKGCAAALAKVEASSYAKMPEREVMKAADVMKINADLTVDYKTLFNAKLRDIEILGQSRYNDLAARYPAACNVKLLGVMGQERIMDKPSCFPNVQREIDAMIRTYGMITGKPQRRELYTQLNNILSYCSAVSGNMIEAETFIDNIKPFLENGRFDIELVTDLLTAYFQSPLANEKATELMMSLNRSTLLATYSHYNSVHEMIDSAAIAHRIKVTKVQSTQVVPFKLMLTSTLLHLDWLTGKEITHLLVTYTQQQTIAGLQTMFNRRNISVRRMDWIDE